MRRHQVGYQLRCEAACVIGNHRPEWIERVKALSIDEIGNDISRGSIRCAGNTPGGEVLHRNEEVALFVRPRREG